MYFHRKIVLRQQVESNGEVPWFRFGVDFLVRPGIWGKPRNPRRPEGKFPVPKFLRDYRGKAGDSGILVAPMICICISDVVHWNH